MAGKSPFGEKELARIKALFEDGETVEAIADEMGCTDSTIMRHIRQMGLTREKPKRIRILTPEQKRFILDNHETMTVHAMAGALGLPWNTVRNRMRDMGLPGSTRDDYWTPEEIDRFKKLAAEKKTLQEISDIMGRSINGLRKQAQKSSIVVYQPGRKWTLEEIDYLRRNWGYVSVATIAKNVNRDIDAVCQKAHKMRLPPVYSLSENLTLADFCRATGISRDRILGTLAPKHDFPLISKKYGKSQYYYYVDFGTILDWLESHQDMYDASMIEDCFFVPEPDWLRKKRRRDRFDKGPLTQEAKRRWWTRQEIDHAKLLRKMGYSIEQIANKLGRTHWAVRAKLVDADGGYTLPMFWTSTDFKFIRTHWETMSDKEMAAKLGRSADSVATHRQRMGLKRTDINDRIRKYVTEHWETESDAEMAEALEQSTKKIANIRAGLGLLRDPSKSRKRRTDTKG